jgi:cell division protein FtsL
MEIDVIKDIEKTNVDKLKKLIEKQDKIILDLQNQIKDLKSDIRFYKIHYK